MTGPAYGRDGMGALPPHPRGIFSQMKEGVLSRAKGAAT